MIKKLGAILLLSLPFAAIADPTISAINGTGCVANFDTGKVTYAPPITFYVFVGTEKNLTYSGVSVAPGETTDVPLGTTTNQQPPAPALFIGTNPADAPGHITTNVPNSNAVFVIQIIGGSGCPANYPCVAIDVANQCHELLKKHPLI